MMTTSLDARLRALGEQSADLARQWAQSDFDRSMAALEKLCESPIEMVFAAGLLVHAQDEGPIIGAQYFDTTAIPEESRKEFVERLINRPHPMQEPPTPGSFNFIAQHEIGAYRVDFLLLFYGGVKIVVECDGHEWHERTPEQAERDKTRDRFLQAQGYLVFRFTGREIWRDPIRCAREVWGAAQAEWSRRLDRGAQ